MVSAFKLKILFLTNFQVGNKVSDFFEPKYELSNNTVKKWTEIETHFRVKKGNRYWDELKPVKEYGDEMEKPLYSSFNKSGGMKSNQKSSMDN